MSSTNANKIGQLIFEYEETLNNPEPISQLLSTIVGKAEEELQSKKDDESLSFSVTPSQIIIDYLLSLGWEGLISLTVFIPPKNKTSIEVSKIKSIARYVIPVKVSFIKGTKDFPLSTYYLCGISNIST